MPDYHPSQKIATELEALYSKAILESLSSPLTMVGALDPSKCFDPASLSHLAAPAHTLNFNQKLGHLYEEALGHLLQHNTRYELIAQNKQIINDDKQTIGELDYVLLDKQTDFHVHLELAIKFYLIHQQDNQFRFPGPDARDNYQNKLERLRSHQLLLTRQEPTQKSLWIDHEIHQIQPQHLIQGIFFDHIHAEDDPSPPSANMFCRRRPWLHCNEIASYRPAMSSARVIPKALWICEMTDEIYETLVEVPTDELIELGQQRCTMFVQSASDTPHFLAPDSWPQQH